MDEMENRLARLPGALLPWYRENRRVLPWREQVSAYRTWVSEIMLQQTRVAAVIPYFQRFMAAYPTVEDLAACDEGELMRLWAGLGYYSRARNLRRAARVIAEEYGGAFPRTYQHHLLILLGLFQHDQLLLERRLTGKSVQVSRTVGIRKFFITARLPFLSLQCHRA